MMMMLLMLLMILIENLLRWQLLLLLLLEPNTEADRKNTEKRNQNETKTVKQSHSK